MNGVRGDGRIVVNSKNMYNLNTLKSSSNLSLLFDKVTPQSTKLVVLDGASDDEREIRRLAYYLDKSALKHFITFTIDIVEKRIHVYLIYSEKEPIDDFIRKIQKHNIHVREESMVDSEVRGLLERSKHILLENYIRLALRNFLQSIGYEHIRIGGRTLWKRNTGDNCLYIVDVDVDPNELMGYISVDIRIPSITSLWDTITSGRICTGNLQELLDSTVLVPYRGSFTYGKITDFIDRKISEDIEIEYGKM